jgi:hypothetical protein
MTKVHGVRAVQAHAPHRTDNERKADRQDDRTHERRVDDARAAERSREPGKGDSVDHYA